jgi:hypothetical protein
MLVAGNTDGVLDLKNIKVFVLNSNEHIYTIYTQKIVLNLRK